MARDSSGTKNQPQYSGGGVPADAADLSEIANYAAAVGNRKSDLSSVRTVLTGSDVWDGLEFYETDTGKTWHYINGTGWVFMFQVPTAWANLTLTSGWTATGGVWAAPQYRINQLGEVEIRGQMLPRTGYATTEVFATLPVGMRPSVQVALDATNNATGTPAKAEIVVNPSGQMTLFPTGIGNVNFGTPHFTTV